MTQSPVWYVARVATGHERLVRALAADAGIEVYFPVETRRVRVRARTRDIERPLMRNYVFVRAMPIAEAWEAVRAIRGVVRLLSYHGSEYDIPCPVSAGAVDEFQRLEAAGQYDGIRKAIEREKRRRAERRWRPISDIKQAMEQMEAA